MFQQGPDFIFHFPKPQNPALVLFLVDTTVLIHSKKASSPVSHTMHSAPEPDVKG